MPVSRLPVRSQCRMPPQGKQGTVCRPHVASQRAPHGGHNHRLHHRLRLWLIKSIANREQTHCKMLDVAAHRQKCMLLAITQQYHLYMVHVSKK